MDYGRVSGSEPNCMELKRILLTKKAFILNRWFDVILEAYPSETSRFIQTQSDRFANPVGHSIRKGLEGLFDTLIDEKRSGEISGFLDDILRIRAIQEPVASRALSFIFDLKAVLRKSLEDELENDDGRLMQELSAVDSAVDEQALLGFDVYMKCREKVSELKSQEIRRNTFRLLQQARLVTDLTTLGGEES